MNQTTIAEQAGISQAYLSQILSGVRRPSWGTAKKLANVTKTDPLWWVENQLEKIKKEIG